MRGRLRECSAEVSKEKKKNDDSDFLKDLISSDYETIILTFPTVLSYSLTILLPFIFFLHFIVNLLLAPVNIS